MQRKVQNGLEDIQRISLEEINMALKRIKNNRSAGDKGTIKEETKIEE